MRSFRVLFGRELSGGLFSFWTYLFLGIVAAVTAYWFRKYLVFSGHDISWALVKLYDWPLSFFIVILPPMLTMRLFADEKRTGSLELVMTAPVGDLALVLSKVAAAFVLFMLFLVPIWLALAMLAWIFGSPPDWGQVAAYTIGVSSLGLLFTTLGVFASALSNHAVYAGLLALFGETALMYVRTLTRVIDPDSRAFRVLSYVDVDLHTRTAIGGVIDIRHVVMQLTLSCLFVFWTHRALETRRWL